MRSLDRLRKKIHRVMMPANKAHMKSLHPDFRLDPHGGVTEGYDIRWRGQTIGQTRPLSEMARPSRDHCFIVASGPSLAEIDLQQLQGASCFGVNGAIVKSLEADVPFQYHVILDRNFVRDRLELVEQAILSGGQCAFSCSVLNAIAERKPGLLAHDNLFLLHQINAIYRQPKLEREDFDHWAAAQDGITLHPSALLQRGWVGFSERADLGFFSGQTVVFSALQLARWLGFRRIFILGMDLGGPAEEFTRFYESANAMAKTRLDQDFEPYISPSFEIAGQVAAQQGWEIYNVSPTSRLPADIIPKITFEDALKATVDNQQP